MKYEKQHPVDYEFVPLAFETLGRMGPSAEALLADLGQRLIVATSDARALEFLQQRLSVAILRGNAASILGSLVEEDSVHRTQEDYLVH